MEFFRNKYNKMNITLFPSECKVTQTNFCPLSAEELHILTEAGIISKKFRSYRLIVSHRQIQLDCPILAQKNRSVGVLLPAYKLPYRPYPCFVYLYAIALCLIGFSMRKAAKQTGKKFGIPQFSHSTISRIFPKLEEKVSMLESGWVLETEEDKTQSNSPPLFRPLPGKPVQFVSPKGSVSRKESAPMLFRVLSPLLTHPELGILLVYQFFMRYCCLLF